MKFWRMLDREQELKERGRWWGWTDRCNKGICQGGTEDVADVVCMWKLEGDQRNRTEPQEAMWPNPAAQYSIKQDRLLCVPSDLVYFS